MSAPEKAKIFFLRCRFLALPLLLALSDFSIRRSYLFSQSAKEFGIFFLSVFYEILFYAVIFFLLSRVKKLRTLLIGIFSAGLSVVLILLYGHYFYFGVLPNNASINFILDHVQDAFALTSASIHWYHGIIFMLLFIIIFFFTKLGTEAAASFSKKISYSSLALFLGISLVLNNNVRFHPDSYSITPNMLFAVNYVAQERLFGSQFEIRRGYVKRQFTILPKEKTVPAFNCLLLIGESVRGKNMHYNGYQRETTPFVDSLLSSGRSISFPRYAANCVSTQYAVPLILSGNFTAEKLPQPYIYDYLKSWTTAKTFFVSSQSMVVSNIHLVYESMLDTFLCRERTTLPAFNDMGVNDASMLPAVRSFLETKSKEKFFGIVQFNNTHYPYQLSEKQFAQFIPAEKLSLNSYDNALLEQDNLIRSYFALLSNLHLLDSTVIIFTADHSEAFNEHGHSGHLQTLYQEDISVPLWMYFPPSFPKNKIQTAAMNQTKNISHLDLFPTILSLFGIAQDSLLNLTPAGTSLFTPLAQERIIPLFGMDMIDTKGIISDTIKYLVSLRGNKKVEEVYDLKNDPNEQHNLLEKLTSQEMQALHKKFFAAEELRFSYKTRLQ